MFLLYRYSWTLQKQEGLPLKTVEDINIESIPSRKSIIFILQPGFLTLGFHKVIFDVAINWKGDPILRRNHTYIKIVKVSIKLCFTIQFFYVH